MSSDVTKGLLEALMVVTNDLACLIEESGKDASKDRRIKTARAAIARAEASLAGHQPDAGLIARDDVIRMAREAGVISSSPFFGVWENHALQLERFAHLVIVDFLQRTGQYVTNDASREAALEQARAEQREACASPATRRQSIDALVGDRLTAKKADHICERDGYAVTGVVLTLPGGRACIVNRSAVRWLHGDDDLFNLMHTDTAINQRLFDDAVQTEREACAAVRLPVTAFDFRQKILKGELNAKYDEGFLDGVRAMRAAIRTRGQK